MEFDFSRPQTRNCVYRNYEKLSYCLKDVIGYIFSYPGFMEIYNTVNLGLANQFMEAQNPRMHNYLTLAATLPLLLNTIYSFVNKNCARNIQCTAHEKACLILAGSMSQAAIIISVVVWYMCTTDFQKGKGKALKEQSNVTTIHLSDDLKDKKHNADMALLIAVIISFFSNKLLLWYLNRIPKKAYRAIAEDGVERPELEPINTGADATLTPKSQRITDLDRELSKKNQLLNDIEAAVQETLKDTTEDTTEETIDSKTVDVTAFLNRYRALVQGESSIGVEPTRELIAETLMPGRDGATSSSRPPAMGIGAFS